MENQHKPPIGCKPAWLVAWSRIADLTAAIDRQYESQCGDAKLVEAWAKEIQMQCEIITCFEEDFKNRSN